MRILQCIAGLGKSAGGPSVSVPALCGTIVQQGHEVTLASLAARPGDELAQVPDSVELVLHSPTRLLPRKLGASRGLKQWLTNHVSSYDIVHAHGLWMQPSSYAATAARKHEVPFVFAPLGMLHVGALKRRALVKRVAWRLWVQECVRRTTCLHATGPGELDAIRAARLTAPVAVVPNGIHLPQCATRAPPKHEHPYALFLGRVHPYKNVHHLVEAWRSCRTREWRLIIAGPGDGRYVRQIRASVEACGEEIQWMGPVWGEAKWKLLADAGLLVLPSKSENFGMVVAEALAARTPVITTKGAPWQELETHRCGWWIDMGVESLIEALEKAMSHSPVELHEMGRRGRQLVEEKYTWDRVAGQMIEVYEWLLGRGPRPDCVVT